MCTGSSGSAKSFRPAIARSSCWINRVPASRWIIVSSYRWTDFERSPERHKNRHRERFDQVKMIKCASIESQCNKSSSHTRPPIEGSYERLLLEDFCWKTFVESRYGSFVIFCNDFRICVLRTKNRTPKWELQLLEFGRLPPTSCKLQV